MAYSGTLVVSDQANGVLVATGAATEIGSISGMLAAVEALTTPLLEQMARFARWLTGMILLFSRPTPRPRGGERHWSRYINGIFD